MYGCFTLHLWAIYVPYILIWIGNEESGCQKLPPTLILQTSTIALTSRQLGSYQIQVIAHPERRFILTFHHQLWSWYLTDLIILCIEGLIKINIDLEFQMKVKLTSCSVILICNINYVCNINCYLKYIAIILKLTCATYVMELSKFLIAMLHVYMYRPVRE